ncbi:RepB family plasmid replication initiator protein [Colwellia maritima]|uniref:RepB family plasmid replication initiator protein n=1 Tax=Colwellia maritima TaxID=2912588 RepID=UPI003084206E
MVLKGLGTLKSRNFVESVLSSGSKGDWRRSKVEALSKAIVMLLLMGCMVLKGRNFVELFVAKLLINCKVLVGNGLTNIKNVNVMELIEQKNERELRAINRQFSLGEYGQSRTKLERYLFIEIYNVIKDFYMSVSDQNIKTFSSESIYLTLPVEKLDQKLFKLNQKNRDLMNAAEGLSKKQINLKTIDEDGQHGFDFISMFPRLKFDPSTDKDNMYVRVPSEVYEEMVPIESYCLLDLKMISQFNSGNTVRLYEIFKSYAFRKKLH